MTPSRQRLLKTTQFSTDIAAILAATWSLHSSGAVLLVAPLTLGMYRLAVTLSHYSIRRPFWDELHDMLGAVLLMAGLHAGVLLSLDRSWDKSSFLCGWLLALFMLPLARNTMRQLLRRLGLWQHPMILVGDGDNSRDALLALVNEPAMGYQLQAYVRPDANGQWLKQHPHAMVMVALEPEQGELLGEVLHQLSSAGRDYFVIPALRGLPLQGLASFHTFSHEVLLLRASNHLNQLPSQLMKRLFDVSGSLVLLALLLPVMLGLALRLLVEGHPVLFWHERVGRHGKSFQCPKFRTMTPDADARLEKLLRTCETSRTEWEERRKLRNDPRVTQLGRFLRETSLDELPQLWSVFRGDMSLVGPRPVTRGELTHYGDNVSYYKQVLPGITGLWQVSGRSEADYPTRVALDVWYVRNWSLWTDVVILLKTVGVVLKRRGAY